MRAVIYARISHDPKSKDDDDQPTRKGGDGLGVQRQEQDCRELAARLDMSVEKVFIDNDTSAYSGKRRPQFEAMLDAMKNTEFDVLICWHTDRLYRSMKDLERLIDIADVTATSIRTVQGGEIDLSTSAGRMIARILGSVARQESEHMSERRLRFNIQKAEAGKWQTVNRPFGYDMKGVPVEPEATAYRTAVADVLSGKSIRRVAAEWNAQGLQTTLAGQERKHGDKTKVVGGAWNSPRVRRLLVNPRYAGLKTHNGKVIGQGDWTPLIDEETYRGLVAYLSNPSRRKHTAFERKYIGSGVYVCGNCGGLMKSAKPTGRKSYAYVCRDNADLLRTGAPLDDFVTGVVLRRLSAPDAHLLLEDKHIDIPALQSDRNGLVARMAQLGADFATAPPEFTKAALADIQTRMADIDKQLADVAVGDPIAGLIADREQVQARWDDCSPAIQGMIIDALVTVTVLPIPKSLRGPNGFDPAYVRIEWKR